MITIETAIPVKCHRHTINVYGLIRNTKGIRRSKFAIKVAIDYDASGDGGTFYNTNAYLLWATSTILCALPCSYKLIPSIYLALRALPGELTTAVSILTGAAILAGDVFTGILLTATYGKGAEKRHHETDQSKLFHTSAKVYTFLKVQPIGLAKRRFKTTFRFSFGGEMSRQITALSGALSGTGHRLVRL